MPSIRSFRNLTVAIAAALALHAAPAEAAAKSQKKSTSTSSKSTGSKKAVAKKTAAKKAEPKKTVARTSKKAPAKSSSKSYAKAPAKRIDISKIERAESLYRKREAEAPASRSLSFFGSLASAHRYDSRMMRAAEIATARAYGRSHGTCWRYVKNALLDAGVVDSRPKTGYAKQAAEELTSDYGFRRVSCNDPFKAPLGSVLVYGGRGAGHVEFRTKTGFVSDFTTPNPSKRPLIGVYVKP
jgi:hypothetical protein